MSDNIPTPNGTDEQEPVIPQVDLTGNEPVTPEAAPEAEQPLEEPQVPTGQPPATPPAPAPAVPSLDERYRNSSSEAMILNAKNKGLESTLNKLTSEDTPDEAELLAEYPEYKDYNAVTQKLMRETLTNRKRQMRINLTLIEQEADRKWQADLRQLTAKPEYSSLRSDQKFEEFVFKPQHKGVDMQTLADAYLVRTGRATSATPPETPSANPSPAQPSPGLPRGSGGPRTPNKPQKVTLEQAKIIRETNYREYMRLMRADLIENEV